MTNPFPLPPPSPRYHLDLDDRTGEAVADRWPEEQELLDDLVATFPDVLGEDWQVLVSHGSSYVGISWWGGPSRADVLAWLHASWPAMRGAEIRLHRFPRLSESQAVADQLQRVWRIRLPLGDECAVQGLGGLYAAWWELPVHGRALRDIFADLCEGVLDVVPPAPPREEFEVWLLHRDAEIREAAVLLVGQGGGAPALG